MGVRTVVATASIALATFIGGAIAGDRTTDLAGNGFSTVQNLQAVPLSDREMGQIRGADNLWIWRNGRLDGTKPLLRSGHPGFGSASTNWIVGCGGAPRVTTFESPGC